MPKNKRIGWMNGKWENIGELMLPINDRGLNYADGIFETILILEGEIKLLEAHIKRWEVSAKMLGMALPPKQNWLTPIIKEGIKLCSLQKGSGALRLNWTRGCYEERGIAITSSESNASTHQFWMEISPIQLSFNPLSTIISCNEKRNAHSQLTLCKTFAYGQAIQAKREAKIKGFDDALLENNEGELSCGTTANLIIKRNNKLLTPRIKSGCLPGIMRQQGLNSGIIQEAKINSKPEKNDQWLLINSLGCHPISQVNEIGLHVFSKSKQLWDSLYEI